jgi:hypothetical protein
MHSTPFFLLIVSVIIMTITNGEKKRESQKSPVPFSQPLPLPLWNNQQVLLYFGLYSGFTNQRITFLNAAFFARMTGMKLVLPQWKFDFSDYIGGTLFPFDYVLEFDPMKLQTQLGVLSSRHNFTRTCHATSSKKANHS